MVTVDLLRVGAALVLCYLMLPAFSAGEAAPLDGVWQTQGYGQIWRFHGTEGDTFEITGKSCLPSFKLKQTGEGAFRDEDGGALTIRAGGDQDHRLVHAEGSASDIRISRLARLPKICESATPDTPGNNFDVFASTWAEHYISFDLKRVDWENVVARHRSKITAQTTPSQLFDVLQAMIEPFGDAHTFIQGPTIKRRFSGIRPGTDRALNRGPGQPRVERSKILAVTERAYFKEEPLRQFCNGKAQYGLIDGQIGYLRILAFGGYAKEGGFAAGLRELEAMLDSIFSGPTLKGLIIDVRLNSGGADPYGLTIASRLATEKYLAYTKYARADPVDRNKWTPGDPSWVRPSSRPGFRGPVVELIGPLSVSAAETLTQALMGRVPHVTRTGENTQGVFSDVLVRKLPNGWTFGLPNEVFRTADGRAFDGPGIPPDIAVPVFAEDDLAAGRDPAMAKALEILRSGK
jgi:hypothetical protein